VKLSRALAGLLVVYSTLAGAAVTADESRERRSAEQIVPQLMVGDAVWLATPHHPKVLALYVEPLPATRNAVILVHGMGVNPDWNLIGVLRMALAELGFATLSVQMPVLGADAPRNDYNAVFPDAGERLDAATDWLRARSYERIAVVSHSMGSAMVNAWLAPRRRRCRCSTSSPSTIFRKRLRSSRRERPDCATTVAPRRSSSAAPIIISATPRRASRSRSSRFSTASSTAAAAGNTNRGRRARPTSRGRGGRESRSIRSPRARAR
jgi:pimeloyl-ACP methyl ester carboxylesterase